MFVHSLAFVVVLFPFHSPLHASDVHTILSLASFLSLSLVKSLDIAVTAYPFSLIQFCTTTLSLQTDEYHTVEQYITLVLVCTTV